MSRIMPALSDGRTFTTYVSAGQREEALQARLGVMNENQYRSVLQNAAPRAAAQAQALLFPHLPRGELTPKGR